MKKIVAIVVLLFVSLSMLLAQGGIKSRPRLNSLPIPHSPSSGYKVSLSPLGASPEFQLHDSIQVKAGWNLLSIPLFQSKHTKDSLFPSASSSAFTYDSIAYVVIDTSITMGKGFWVKFDSSETFHITGNIVLVETVKVDSGWNLIGSSALMVDRNLIQTIPAGIITSKLFGYGPELGYQLIDTLQPGSGYWVRVNQKGVLILSFVGSCLGTPTVEYAGTTYNTLQIGNQCWLKENLNVGTMIDSLHYQTDNSTIEKYCYHDSAIYCDTYGGLYQWDEAMQYTMEDSVKGICPTGWHIPSSNEFHALQTLVNNNGNALKALGQGVDTGSGTNISGFSALLAGFQNVYGNYGALHHQTFFWGSSRSNPVYGDYLCLFSNDDLIYFNVGNREDAMSVRCIKN